MLIYKDTKFIKSPFNSETELEQVVIENYEYLFGPNSIYLPKALIKTADGDGTIPDGFAVDIEERKWFIVEAELIHHSVWNHIAPQITKQLLASQQVATKRIIEELTVKKYENDPYIKEKFTELNISAVNVRKVISEIMETEPIIGVPIDGISNDLRDWARTLKYKVKLWVVNKFVELNNTQNIVFEFPEEFRPELDTEIEAESVSEDSEVTRYDIEIMDLIASNLIKPNEILTMTYKPRNGNGKQKKYDGKVLEDGSISVLGQVFSSPSYAALAGIQDSGSDRKTVNGWTSWKNSSGITLAELREALLKESEK